jgi:hypothetical protein
MHGGLGLELELFGLCLRTPLPIGPSGERLAQGRSAFASGQSPQVRQIQQRPTEGYLLQFLAAFAFSLCLAV